MGLFGSSDDTDDTDEEESTTRGDEQSGEATSGESTHDRVSDLVADVQGRSGSDRTRLVEDVTGRLDRSDEEHVVAARALARVAREDPEAIDPVADHAIDQLAERDLARPIAESYLHTAAEFQPQDIDYGTLAEGALDALVEADTRLDGIRIDSETAPGGGASEVALASELREHARSVRGRKQLTVESAADALEAVINVLAGQADLDPIDAIVDMRTKVEGDEMVGIDVGRGEIRDATDPSMTIPESELRARLADGIALGVIVSQTRGTVTQLETLTGHDPYPE